MSTGRSPALTDRKDERPSEAVSVRHFTGRRSLLWTSSAPGPTEADRIGQIRKESMRQKTKMKIFPPDPSHASPPVPSIARSSSLGVSPCTAIRYNNIERRPSTESGRGSAGLRDSSTSTTLTSVDELVRTKSFGSAPSPLAVHCCGHAQAPKRPRPQQQVNSNNNKKQQQ